MDFNNEQKNIPCCVFLACEWGQCSLCVFSVVYSSHVTTAVDKTNSARMLGTTGDCSVVHRLMPVRWPQEASCMYKYALGPALYALLTEAVSYYCDRCDSRKEYE